MRRRGCWRIWDGLDDDGEERKEIVVIEKGDWNAPTRASGNRSEAPRFTFLCIYSD